jgi:periplasmic protein TonB
MFETATLPSGPVGTRFWTTGAGFAGELILVAGAALLPMVIPQAPPAVPTMVRLVSPGPPRQSEAAPEESGASAPRRPVVRQLWAFGLLAPVRIPASAMTFVDNPADFAEPRAVGVKGGAGVGVPDNLLRDILAAAAPPVAPVARSAPAETKPAATPVRVRQGGLVRPATLVHRVDPVYPALAQRMRIAGVVTLEGVIGADGRIRELAVKSGHPLLVKAALDAVSQWVYAPTTLNGDPVEVIAPIIVTFRMN